MAIKPERHKNKCQQTDYQVNPKENRFKEGSINIITLNAFGIEYVITNGKVT